MILTRKKILKEMEKGNIKIEPFSPEQLGPASVDLHLDNVFRRFIHQENIFSVTEKANYEKITELVKKKKIVLGPHETIHGITKETINLSKNICGWLEGRSRFARLGILIHISAGFIQPGVTNKQVLEICNVSPIKLSIPANLKICQVIFQYCKGKAKYKGKFMKQTMP